MSKLTLRAQTVDIAYLPLRQDLFAKNVLMTVQRDFRLGSSPRAADCVKKSLSYTRETNSMVYGSNPSGCFLAYSDKSLANKLKSEPGIE